MTKNCERYLGTKLGWNPGEQFCICAIGNYRYYLGKMVKQNLVTVCPMLKVVHVSALMCIRKKMNFKYPFPLEKISSLKLCN